ncbi:tryptophan-rich sensory protein [Luteolibacter pohnpeiensis]|uniref:Tryptophan-rich sensory protein n=1 Tax=Luteolibacter pohnpeiensis TaxID=454153 RepID=A0A934S8K1_9BACT|nr:TspO/MBR family protein [Luteolibacter pohnpeiensis]MBK1883320.1 tryptophan-rich sensory protein [Luteolibacter pohnpeiensis]
MNDELPGEQSFSQAAWILPSAAAILCLIAGAASGLISVEGGGVWYEKLNKPPGTPAASVFGPVWTVLYLMMGAAAGRLVHRRQWKAFWGFLIQLVLNLAWTPMFFGAHQIVPALGIIAILGLILGWTIREAEHSDKVSAYLLLPYLLWVGYATYLNAGIAWLNR